MNQHNWESLAQLPLTQWKPRSSLAAEATRVPRSAVPAIDIHNHLGRWLSPDGDWMITDVPAFIAMLDALGVVSVVNLDGMWANELEANLDRYDRAYPGRFHTFCQLDWQVIAQPNGMELLEASLRASAAAGARGVKVWKNLGLHVRDATGRLVSPDDDRVVHLMRVAGELDLPVLIHTADPKSFFDPADDHNERLEELLEEPDWWFGDRERFPTFNDLLGAHAALVIACPQTRFIGAHAGCAAEDLDLVESLLLRAPNYSIDIAGRMAELGRQPRRFRALVERFTDRVLFGTDIFPATAAQYQLHFRFLESADEAFEYAPESPIPPQGRWTVSGIELPPAALAAVYRDNAVRFLGIPAAG